VKIAAFARRQFLLSAGKSASYREAAGHRLGSSFLDPGATMNALVLFSIVAASVLAFLATFRP
jgi:hypothetical protein